MSEEITNIVVYPSGNIVNLDIVREVVIKYWELPAPERQVFLNMIDKYPECPDSFKDALNK